MSLSRLLKLLTPHQKKTAGRANDPALPRKLARFIDYIMKRDTWIYRPNCLRRSLVLYHLLRKSGFEVQICFGVKFADSRKEQGRRGEMGGHAWLLWRGRPILEPASEEIPSYTLTLAYPDGDKALQAVSAQSEH